MSLKKEFVADVRAFLGRYALNIAAGMESTTTSGKYNDMLMLSKKTPKYVHELFDMPDVDNGVGVSDAPMAYAYFKMDQPATYTDIFPFSKSRVMITLDRKTSRYDDKKHWGLPIYIIPYCGGSGLGVRLPAGDEDAYAVTTTLNGCTVEISGPHDSPVASHTNVIDIARREKRKGKLKRRLVALKDRFEKEYGLDDYDKNRVRFGHYAIKDDTTSYNYSQDVRNFMTSIEGRTFKGGREELSCTSHRRYMITPTKETIEDNTDDNTPPDAIVLGHRTGGSWTFYYQEISRLQFHVEQVDKVGPKLVTGRTTIQTRSGAPKKHDVIVIVNHGELWPFARDNWLQLG